MLPSNQWSDLWLAHGFPGRDPVECAVRVDAPLLVREATTDDADAIGEVHAEAWRVAHRDLFESHALRQFVAERRDCWTDVMLSQDFARNTVLLAVRDDRVVAFVHFGPHQDGTPDGQIFDLYAHPSVWGRGVAAALMDTAWELLRETGFRRVRLWTMAGANRCRHFYASYGFEETGRTREHDFGDGRPVLEFEYLRRTS
jgi:ribosomal protein S18 acetylase RimI-like enzyme